MQDNEKSQNEFASDHVVQMYHNAKMPAIVQNPARIIHEILKEHGILDNDRNGGTLLDVACGDGVITKLLAKYFEHTIGIDPSHNQLKKACESTIYSGQVEFKLGTAESLPIADNSVDVITCVLSLHFIDIDLFMKECRRVLKRGGIAIFYRHLVKAITPLGNTKLPMIVMEITQMFDKCSKLAKAVSHPERHILDRYETLYDSIKWQDKTKRQGTFEFPTKFSAIRDLYLSIPFYANLGDATRNPVIQTFDQIKKILSKNGIFNDETEVKVTYDTSSIILK